MRLIDRNDQRHQLEQHYQWRSECAHQRKPVSRTNHHIKKRNRPGDEDDHFEEICDRATANRVAPDGQERGLKNESQGYRNKIESHWAKKSAAQFQNGVGNRHQKTNG